MLNGKTAYQWQPQGIAQISPLYLPFVQSARLYSNPATLGAEASKRIYTPFTKTGTVTDGVLTPYGIGVQGNGTNGYYSRLITGSFQPGWVACSFVCNTVSSAQKMIFCQGGSTSAAAFFGIQSGTGSASSVSATVRLKDSAASFTKIGVTPIAGKVYNCVFVVPSITAAESYLYINGIKYTAQSGTDLDATGWATKFVESVGAMRRQAASFYSPDIALFTARGDGILPENLAQILSINPWNTLFARPKQALYTKSLPGKWRIDSSKNLHISGRKVVTGTEVSFQSAGNLHATAFNTSPGVFKFDSSGGITANSFIEDAIL